MAVTHTAVLVGAEVQEIEVETFVGQGFSGLNILGIGGDALRDMRERVRAVLEGVGIPLPARRIVVNLAPSQSLRLCRTPLADLEFAVAACVVRALDEARGVKPPPWREFFSGGLSLTGELRPPLNSLVLRTLAALSSGNECSYVVGGRGQESLVGLKTFGEWYTKRDKRFSSCEAMPCSHPKEDSRQRQELVCATISLFESNPRLLVALLASAAGAHHILLAGEPGVGKSFALRRLPDLLPPLSAPERMVRELLVEGDGGWERPVRTPHHTTTSAALIGGAQLRLGEATLAHLGLLFLDELAEFSRPALEGLREPLDAGVVVLSRASGTVKLPAQFLLAASTNPCACGYVFSRKKACRCPQGDTRKYQKKFSGPLLDRFPIQMLLSPLESEDSEQNGFVDALVALLQRKGAGEVANRLEQAQRRLFSLETIGEERSPGLVPPAWMAARLSRRGVRELGGLAGTLHTLFPEVVVGEGKFWEDVEGFRKLETLLGSSLV